MQGTNALLIVDVQNDLFSNGLFSIPDSESIIPVINNYISNFVSAQFPIIASRDWHPPITHHFDQYGGKWPAHCIANSWGAQFHTDISLPKSTIIISKGLKPEEDTNSAFQSYDDNGKSLSTIIDENKISRLSICGLATDYCVKFTTLHALERGIKVHLLIDAIKGLNLLPSDSIRSIDEMIRFGAEPLTIDSFSFI